jgi:hypothetical protein
MAMMLYIIGLPLFVALSFALFCFIYRLICLNGTAKYSIVTGFVLPYVLCFCLERLGTYVFFASGYIYFSESIWGAFISGIWMAVLIITMILSFLRQNIPG